LEWTPDVFWASTPHDFFAALSGLREKNNPKALTEEQAEELLQLLDEDSARANNA
jgi:hypothetical protein